MLLSACCPGTNCFGQCVDLSSAHDDCGACFHACNPEESCVDGRCACPDGLTSCGEVCADTATSALHCGGCGRACSAGASCIEGTCVCPAANPDVCADRCVALSSDRSNCGTCDNRCPSTSACVASDCVCPGVGADLCDGACVDLLTDAANCGACGTSCGLGCFDGVCRRVEDLAIGLSHACIQLSDGTVRCWGSNAYGQLGLGSSVTSARSTEVPLDSPVTALAAGHWHTCAFAGTSTFCWGRGDAGQLGHGVYELEVFDPSVVLGAPPAARLAAEWEATCALGGDQSVWCWGNERQGLVIGGTGYVLSPRRLFAGPADLLTVGSSHVCWRDASTLAVTCQPGTLRETIDTPAFTGATDLAAGSSHVCALVAGDVLCAGTNREGQLGDGTSTTSIDTVVRTPRRALLPEPAIDVAAVGAASCALGASGTVYCWGSNRFEPYVFGVTRPGVSALPRVVEGVTGDRLFCAEGQCCTLRGLDEVTCWGGSIVSPGPARVIF